MKYSVLLFALILANSALAGFEFYGQIGPGWNTMDETSGGSSYKHSSAFFVGHWTYGVGARAKIEMGHFHLGAVLDGAWVGDSVDRKQNGVVNDTTYRFESYRTIGGAHVAFYAGTFSLIGEYYPYVQNWVSYSDEKTENPFVKNDRLYGTGYGLGLKLNLDKLVGFQFLYKNLQYNKVDSRGLPLELPNSTYSKFITNEFTVAIVFGF